MFERIRAIIKENIIIIILEFNKLEPSSSIMPEGLPSGIILEVGSSWSGCGSMWGKWVGKYIMGEWVGKDCGGMGGDVCGGVGF